MIKEQRLDKMNYISAAIPTYTRWRGRQSGPGHGELSYVARRLDPALTAKMRTKDQKSLVNCGASFPRASRRFSFR